MLPVKPETTDLIVSDTKTKQLDMRATPLDVKRESWCQEAEPPGP
jgi:hypothetical protein